jgi:hypothetical protein
MRDTGQDLHSQSSCSRLSYVLLNGGACEPLWEAVLAPARLLARFALLRGPRAMFVLRLYLTFRSDMC